MYTGKQYLRRYVPTHHYHPVIQFVSMFVGTNNRFINMSGTMTDTFKHKVPIKIGHRLPQPGCSTRCNNRRLPTTPTLLIDELSCESRLQKRNKPRREPTRSSRSCVLTPANPWSNLRIGFADIQSNCFWYFVGISSSILRRNSDDFFIAHNPYCVWLLALRYDQDICMSLKNKHRQRFWRRKGCRFLFPTRAYTGISSFLWLDKSPWSSKRHNMCEGCAKRYSARIVSRRRYIHITC